MENQNKFIELAERSSALQMTIFNSTPYDLQKKEEFVQEGEQLFIWAVSNHTYIFYSYFDCVKVMITFIVFNIIYWFIEL